MQPSDHKHVLKLLSEGRHGQALAHCQTLQAAGDTDADVAILTALCFESSGAAEKAYSLLSQTVHEHPNVAEAHFQLGRMALGAGDEDTAHQSFTACIRLDPNHAAAWTFLGRTEAAQLHMSQAVSHLRTALRADPDYVPALSTLATLLTQLEQLDEARNMASHAVKLEPNNSAAQLALAQVLMAEGYWSFAEQCLNNAQRADPENPRVHWTWADFLQHTGRHHEALAAIQSVARLSQLTPRLRRAQAVSLRKTGQLREAAEAWQSLLAEFGSDAVLCVELSAIYVQLGDLDALQALYGTLTDNDLKQWVEAHVKWIEGMPDQTAALIEPLTSHPTASLSKAARMLSIELAAQASDQRTLTRHVNQWLNGTPSMFEPALHWQVAQHCRAAHLPQLGVEVLHHLLRQQKLDDMAIARSHCLLGHLYDELGQIDEAAGHLLKGGWQPAYLGEPDDHRADAATIRSKLDHLQLAPRPSGNADEPSIIVVLGWPMSGRDLLVSALAQAKNAKVQRPESWAERKKMAHLNAPLDSQLDEASALLMRRRYLKSLRPIKPGTQLIESAALSVLQLAHLGRLFKHVHVITADAELDHLVLHWRLSGYQQIPSMISYWERDQEVLSYAKERLPVNWTTVGLAALLSNTSQTIGALYTGLGLQASETMAEIVATQIRLRGYRPLEDAQGYGEILYGQPTTSSKLN